MKRVELLAPAGTPEKGEIAAAFGADALYFGIEGFNLRARSGNFSFSEAAVFLDSLHSRGKKGYATLNIYPREEEWPMLEAFIRKMASLPLDGVIVSTPGVLSLVRRSAPRLPLHVSTQANVTESASARAWKEWGASRVILARELSLEEIRAVTANSGVETEVFIHGAMCMAYSGRCLMSKYMTGRDANAGDCAHPCRWRWYVREESRQNELFEVTEDERGLYIFNSKDLMLYDYIRELTAAGVSSLKIEGRIKGILYVATIVRAYRLLLDAFYRGETPDPRWRDSLFEANNRGYHPGFLIPGGYESQLSSSRTTAPYDLLGYIDREGFLEAKAPVEIGKTYEALQPLEPETVPLTISSLYSPEGESLERGHPGKRYGIKASLLLKPFSVIRYRRIGETK
ncbi:MAG TPA: U32 family peptidase [Firmicutes bacterium]|nr:U32 family peptidase [Bacillota bacterium]